jgi:cytochrome c556
MTNFPRNCLAAAAGALFLTLSTAASAASMPMPPEKAIKARQAAYFLMGQQMARINATIKGDMPFDKQELQLNAHSLELLSRLVVDNYPAGSDQGSKAKPEVWKDAARFRHLAEAMTLETGGLKNAISNGDLPLLKAAYGKVSQSCKACHDNFKAR